MRYKFKFHSNIDRGTGTRLTQVDVLDTLNDTYLAAYAKQHKKDQDCKLLGQRAAVENITKSYDMSKIERKTLWFDFFSSSEHRAKFFNPKL